MRKLLRPKDVLLLGLAGVFDIFEQMRDPFGLRAESCEYLYGFVPERFKKHNFYDLIWRSLKTAEIEKIEKDGHIFLRITNQGEDKIKRDFPLLSLSKKLWDKKWRIVIFDIEEQTRSVRDKLRDKLKELGFGMWQKSVWISPHDIVADFSEFLESSSLLGKVCILEATTLIGEAPKELASRIWHLEDLNKKYQYIYQDLMESYDRGKSSDKMSRSRKFKEIRERFVEVLLSDPFLPRQLLPDDFVRDKLWKLLR